MHCSTVPKVYLVPFKVDGSTRTVGKKSMPCALKWSTPSNKKQSATYINNNWRAGGCYIISNVVLANKLLWSPAIYIFKLIYCCKSRANVMHCSTVPKVYLVPFKVDGSIRTVGKKSMTCTLKWSTPSNKKQSATYINNNWRGGGVLYNHQCLFSHTSSPS